MYTRKWEYIFRRIQWVFVFNSSKEQVDMESTQESRSFRLLLKANIFWPFIVLFIVVVALGTPHFKAVCTYFGTLHIKHINYVLIKIKTSCEWAICTASRVKSTEFQRANAGLRILAEMGSGLVRETEGLELGQGRHAILGGAILYVKPGHHMYGHEANKKDHERARQLQSQVVRDRKHESVLDCNENERWQRKEGIKAERSRKTSTFVFSWLVPLVKPCLPHFSSFSRAQLACFTFANPSHVLPFETCVKPNKNEWVPKQREHILPIHKTKVSYGRWKDTHPSL